MEDLIDKNELNVIMLNNIKHKKNRNSDMISNPNNVNYFTNTNKTNHDLNTKKIIETQDLAIRLNKANNFENERRENKNQMMTDTEIKMEKISLNNLNTNITQSNFGAKKVIKNNSRSILEYIGKKSGTSSPRSFGSLEDSEFKIVLESNRNLEEIREDEETKKERKPNANNKKKRGFMIDDKQNKKRKK
jgi:hypothetical protein